jgi:arginyl-tRNA synthetase
MNPFEELRRDVLDAVAACQAAGELPQDLPLASIVVEPPRDLGHGDAATNAAMLLARVARRPPIQIAEALALRLRALDKVEAAEVARPGFVNLRLADDFWRHQVKLALDAGPEYGAADLGRGLPVNVEYCSANPTGPLHIGHARGTIFGDALANLLARMGYAVTREYYINDGGAQIDHVARSVHYRYLEALGAAPADTPPEGLYPGDYLIPLGERIAREDGDRWRDAPESAWLPEFRTRTVAAMMALIRDALEALGVRHDVFTSEAAMIEQRRIEQALAELEKDGLIYLGTLPPPKGKPR